MNAKEWLLKITQEVEDDPSRWTTLVFARDKMGFGVRPESRLAVCWCAVGFQHRDGNFSATPALVKACDIDHAFYNDNCQALMSSYLGLGELRRCANEQVYQG